MDDKFTELREFVYLNELSLNSHLSSLGVGIPEEILQKSGSETEKSGSAEGGLTIPGTSLGIKGGGRLSHMDTSNVQTRMQITAPYRFEELLNQISENGFDIIGNKNLGGTSRGDVVKIEGKIWPMSLFKVETAIKLFLEVMEEETLDNIEELPGDTEDSQQEITDEDYKQFKAMNQVIEKFIGETIPIRMHRNGIDAGISLDRSFMRTNPFRTFAEEKEFTLVGRVMERLRHTDLWDPNDLTNLMREYISIDEAEEMLKNFEEDIEASEDINISFEEKDRSIQAPGIVVFPIAIYW